MKYILLILSILLSECTVYDPIDIIEKKFPKSKILQIPDDHYKHVVCDTNGNVYYITTVPANGKLIIMQVK